MNLENIRFHLEEAKEELEKTIQDIKDDKEYDFGEFVVAMSHLYHHVNTAWNSRNASTSEVDGCTEDNFKKWRKFPNNEELLLSD